MNTEQQLKERAEARLTELFSGNHETYIRKAVIMAMIDFHKQELSGKEIYEAVSVEDELPEAEERVICFRGTERLTFSWPAREFKDLKVTHWLKKTTIKAISK